MTDILSQTGYLALGSRLKRLAERMQADAARAHLDMGYPMQPGHFPLFAALHRHGPLTVGEAVDIIGMSQPGITRIHNSLARLGLTRTDTSKEDRRTRTISLTDEGKALIERMERDLWPHIARGAEEACDGVDALAMLSRIEAALDEKSLLDRITASRQAALFKDLSIVEYDSSLASTFAEISREWVEEMFKLEPHDIEVLENPEQHIIQPGGTILFVQAPDLGIVGCGALMPVEGASYELTKMGVRKSARGRKAGEFLLDHLLQRAGSLPIEELFLLTNSKCQAAIHLYEKAGFIHDADILGRFGPMYARADVAMSFDLEAA
ncbi:bifunctional helix-turn-helix transcriptional regulator/GNAT family N-acetyltransferase [Henriciella pelagia]|jgi:DNA-binding MarR family transcriptional regulator|uniref:MarR family transcriptional regulator n=1 Tax=Henriciella pelagia TaxID=1977912 RepID=A0ABQ1JTL8_9PROT|nr:bifunctional helix-turn-helix transcriptional regulator/GNAT family N-acetyltransferase [Henriciella pelagia]GGB77542.1 MarR family transcriptional regulator [Henriciella pelagia]